MQTPAPQVAKTETKILESICLTVFTTQLRAKLKDSNTSQFFILFTGRNMDVIAFVSTMTLIWAVNAFR
jgi:hypothetical protein